MKIQSSNESQGRVTLICPDLSALLKWTTTAMISKDYNSEPYASTREKPITILWGVNLEMVSSPGVIIACKFIVFIEHVPVGMLHERDTKLTLLCALLNLCRYWKFVKPLCHFLWNSFMYILEYKLLGICSCWLQFTVWIHQEYGIGAVN